MLRTFIVEDKKDKVKKVEVSEVDFKVGDGSF